MGKARRRNVCAAEPRQSTTFETPEGRITAASLDQNRTTRNAAHGACRTSTEFSGETTVDSKSFYERRQQSVGVAGGNLCATCVTSRSDVHEEASVQESVTALEFAVPRIGGSRGPSLVCLIAAALMLAIGWRTSLVPSPLGWKMPETPVDLGSARYAAFWRFLKEARRLVPDNASYTAIAKDPEDEMYLFMLSLGIFERHEALASSYYGVPTPQEGDSSRFVLAFDKEPSPPTSFRLVARVGPGSVFERRRPA
jgi:hypothetical protein